MKPLEYGSIAVKLAMKRAPPIGIARAPQWRLDSRQHEASVAQTVCSARTGDSAFRGDVLRFEEEM